jgi:Rrf2 family nitric oxide-sensitive transcriptional repressor
VRLTSYSDYAFRLLLYLGANADEVVPVSVIAETFGISTNHLAKVAKDLTAAGYLRGHRGAAGGFQLARAAEDIGLGAVLRMTEPDFFLVECFSEEENACPLTGACKLERVFSEALAAFLAVFDRYTLADLLRSRTLRQRLLVVRATPLG